MANWNKAWMAEFYSGLVKNTLANALIIQIFVVITWEIYGLIYERVETDHSNLYDLSAKSCTYLHTNLKIAALRFISCPEARLSETCVG